jgi:hypothetical protein
MKKSITLAGLAGLCAFALTGPAFAGCLVAPGDFAALKVSKSELTSQGAVDGLTDADQTLLCSTRALVRQVETGNGHLSSEPGQFSTVFMSPQEISLVDTAVTEWVAAAEKSQPKPPGDAPAGLSSQR